MPRNALNSASSTMSLFVIVSVSFELSTYKETFTFLPSLIVKLYRTNFHSFIVTSSVTVVGDYLKANSVG
jgi:hypothetical protein